jgi:hypothetical protein
MRTIFSVIIVLSVWIGIAPQRPSKAAPATIYEVGPGKPYASLGQVAGLLSPGDLVLVYSNGAIPYIEQVVFENPGAPNNKITIRGVRVNGRRPILSSTQSRTVEFAASHYIFEGFEATGTGSNHRVLYHHADDITIRDTLVRDCPLNGILGADEDSGSLTLEYVEVTNCGEGTYHHGVYMATALPGAVFRMQYCYLHDMKGGNAVKSRAFRNEIYYNWIEDAYYHELELIGPDDGTGGLPGSPREDSDVVGNVLFHTSDFGALTRVGGDGTGQTWGRYRFANNTFVAREAGTTMIRAFDGLESIELHNNIFTSADGGWLNLVRTVEADWLTNQETIGGSHNWIQTGSTVPSGLGGSLYGSDPGFNSLAGQDVRPTDGSPLVDAGNGAPASLPGHEFPNPLIPPAYHPLLHTMVAVGNVENRPVAGTIDIGAFEFGEQIDLPVKLYLPLVNQSLSP